ncbi:MULTISPECIES: hypothetical protein [unclassified Bradyrhizobium]|uniref:hypothetical protein n=1 Tax=unclassified Bradyrhizobium TaxID=2631580 RepID=UPI0028ED177F|nr:MULTISPECIES: hypothetical protein [unclassified Bradyrhizobium]
MTLNDAQEWAKLAPLATALIALVAVAIAWRQFHLNRKNQRETTAKTTFREFLKLCVLHPKLAYGKSPSDGVSDTDEYEWFVASFLYAAEELLEYDGEDWTTNLKLHLSYHADFLRTNERFRKEDFPAYSPALQRFIRENVEGF